MRAVHNYIKTSPWILEMPLCETAAEEKGQACVRKCAPMKSKKVADCTDDYSHGRCFVYFWGCGPFTVKKAWSYKL